MTLQTEVRRLQSDPRALLPLAVALGLAFAVGLAFRELFDSRAAGAVSALLVLVAFALASALSNLREHPERLVPLVGTAGAGFVASAVIAVAAGSPALALVFLPLGAVSLIYAQRRSSDRG